MSDEIDAAVEKWKQLLVKAQNEYVEDAKAALLVNRHPEHPATRKADESYNRMMRIMLGDGLVLPQGYHLRFTKYSAFVPMNFSGYPELGFRA